MTGLRANGYTFGDTDGVAGMDSTSVANGGEAGTMTPVREVTPRRTLPSRREAVTVPLERGFQEVSERVKDVVKKRGRPARSYEPSEETS